MIRTLLILLFYLPSLTAQSLAHNRERATQQRGSVFYKQNKDWSQWGPFGPCSSSCGGGQRVRSRTCTGGVGCPGSNRDAQVCNQHLCPQNTWKEWSNWSVCSRTCNGGNQFRTRICPQGDCPGYNRDERVCNTVSCAIVGSNNWGQWVRWSACSRTCGGGQQFRTRVCLGGAQNCAGSNNREEKTCNPTPCGIARGNGDWGEWAQWTVCSRSCDGGQQSRTRVCIGGAIRNCPGTNSREERVCNTVSCAIVGSNNWGQWVRWSACSRTCGGGQQFRTRVCLGGAQNCAGSNSREEKTCNPTPCGIGRGNGDWGEWAQWTVCSRSCGGGQQSRTRVCIGGAIRNCPGTNNREERTCNPGTCIRGEWNLWGQWSTCSKICGTGSQTRNRACVGGSCAGSNSDRRTCSTGRPCSVGSWTVWSAFGTCDRSCGNGKQSRRRNCVGGDCPGNEEDFRPCNPQQCPIGIWNQWSQFTACTKTCGTGKQSRRRSCLGQNCAGNEEDSRPCNTQPCNNGDWTNWTAWTACSKICGGGFKTRRRVCQFGGQCPGPIEERLVCNPTPCSLHYKGNWNEWSNWLPCTRTCGGGDSFRRRVCVGQACVGLNEERRVCNPGLCNGEWNQWGPFTPCSNTCGGGRQSRRRVCQFGSACPGLDEDTRPCNPQPCPTGQWTEWSSFLTCSQTCGGGSQTRRRTCQGGTRCPGNEEDSRPCNQQPCSIGDWGAWSAYAVCSATCGVGQEIRRRSCVGGSCPGLDTDRRACNRGVCKVGDWAQWSAWTACSATCGVGKETRRRTCLGGQCPGLEEDVKVCNNRQCAFGSWQQWNEWSACSRTCNIGERRRTRVCPSGGCAGSNIDVGVCNKGACNTRVGDWGQWSQWTVCSTLCGPGNQNRRRTCLAGNRCPGEAEQTKSCSRKPCTGKTGFWNEWSTWSVCTRTCGSGYATRRRVCQGGVNCVGEKEDTRLCNTSPCNNQQPIWGAWRWVRPCSQTCGQGYRTRTRTCVGIGECIGASEETLHCNEQACFG